MGREVAMEIGGGFGGATFVRLCLELFLEPLLFTGRAGWLLSWHRLNEQDPLKIIIISEMISCFKSVAPATD